MSQHRIDIEDGADEELAEVLKGLGALGGDRRRVLAANREDAGLHHETTQLALSTADHTRSLGHAPPSAKAVPRAKFLQTQKASDRGGIGEALGESSHRSDQPALPAR